MNEIEKYRQYSIQNNGILAQIVPQLDQINLNEFVFPINPHSMGMDFSAAASAYRVQNSIILSRVGPPSLTSVDIEPRLSMPAATVACPPSYQGVHSVPVTVSAPSVHSVSQVVTGTPFQPEVSAVGVGYQATTLPVPAPAIPEIAGQDMSTFQRYNSNATLSSGDGTMTPGSQLSGSGISRNQSGDSAAMMGSSNRFSGSRLFGTPGGSTSSYLVNSYNQSVAPTVQPRPAPPKSLSQKRNLTYPQPSASNPVPSPSNFSHVDSSRSISATVATPSNAQISNSYLSSAASTPSAAVPSSPLMVPMKSLDFSNIPPYPKLYFGKMDEKNSSIPRSYPSPNSA